MAVTVRRQRSSPDIWPGFVDAMATLLIIIIFLLMVFTIAQHFLSETLSGRNEALDRLNRQVSELADMLALERNANVTLRRDLSQLSGELQSSNAARDRISSQLAELLPERDVLKAALAQSKTENDRLLAELTVRTKESEKLEADLGAARAAADKVDRDLEDANKVISADREKIELQLRALESLRRDITALRKVRTELEKQVVDTAAALQARDVELTAVRDRTKSLEKQAADTAAALQARDVELTAVRDRTKSLEASLSTEQERTALAQRDIAERDVRLRELAGQMETSASALIDEKNLSAAAREQLRNLGRQIAALRQQLARLATALEASEAEARAQNVQIVNLGQRLNAALASKVQELSRYRSEFFGRLREVLGDQKNIRIVGDRFVFQSEVLFGSGSADLAEGGREQIERLAATLKEIAGRIPKDLDWVLRVDGHTDRVPIRTPKFPSNWELSTGRAISVVKHLIEVGIPPERLAATGFGEFRPIDPANSRDAYGRNRRIEFKLTGR